MGRRGLRFYLAISGLSLATGLALGARQPISLPVAARTIETNLKEFGLVNRKMTPDRLKALIEAKLPEMPPGYRAIARKALDAGAFPSEMDFDFFFVRNIGILELRISDRRFELHQIDRIFDSFDENRVCMNLECEESTTYKPPSARRYFPANTRARKLTLVHPSGKTELGYDIEIEVTKANGVEIVRYFQIKDRADEISVGWHSLKDFLPEFSARRYNRFPNEGDLIPGGESLNCFSSSRLFFKEKPEPQILLNNPIRFRAFLRRNYCMLGELGEDLAYGDILEDADHRHAVRFVLADERGTRWVYSKGNESTQTSWRILPLELAFRDEGKQPLIYQHRHCR